MPAVGVNGGARPALELVDRVDLLEEQIGGVLAELAATREAANVAAGLTRSCLDEILSVKSMMREQEQRRIRECDLRHENIDRRITRLADTMPPARERERRRNDDTAPLDPLDYDDTLDATSAVTYSREALERAYEQRKREVTAAQEAEAIARSRSRAAIWGSVAAILAAVASAVVAALQGCGGG